MAVKQINKLRVYHSLFQINRAFLAIIHHVREIEYSGMFSIYKMGVLRDYARELQAEISHDVVDRMHEIEDSEMYRWEKTRIAREKYLDPDRPR
jgi:hypothetical protein